jgi:hypothetical protein
VEELVRILFRLGLNVEVIQLPVDRGNRFFVALMAAMSSLPALQMASRCSRNRAIETAVAVASTLAAGPPVDVIDGSADGEQALRATVTRPANTRTAIFVMAFPQGFRRRGPSPRAVGAAT